MIAEGRDEIFIRYSPPSTFCNSKPKRNGKAPITSKQGGRRISDL